MAGALEGNDPRRHFGPGRRAYQPETIACPVARIYYLKDLYRKIKRARGREIDVAIAACAIAHNAQLWTLNPADFKDIPNLKLLS